MARLPNVAAFIGPDRRSFERRGAIFPSADAAPGVCEANLDLLRLAMSRGLQILFVSLLAACGGPRVGTSSTSSVASSSGGTHASGSTGATSSGSSGAAGSGGTSSTGGVPCGPGLIWQGESCVVASCGGAGLGTPCGLPDGGFGVCAPSPPDPAMLACQGFNFGSDSANCGELGFQCPIGYTCTGGSCTCPSCSDGSPNEPCLNVECPVGTACVFGWETPFCVLTSCASGTTNQTCSSNPTKNQLGYCCGDQCVSAEEPDGGINLSYCGACGTVCADAGPLPTCDPSLANTLCALPGGSAGYCCQGSCIGPAAQSTVSCGACGLSCTACKSDSNCPQGQACALSEAGTSCAPTTCSGSIDGMACAIAGIVMEVDQCCANEVGLSSQGIFGGELVATECCGGACVDLEQDPFNCGGCNITCPAGTSCQWGACRSAVDCAQAAPGTDCPFSSTAEGICCGGRCIDPSTDDANCTGCGLTCPQGAICTLENCTFPDGGQTSPTAPADCSGLDDGSPCGPAGGGSPYYCCSGVCVTYLGINFSTCAACGFACPACGPGCPVGSACVETDGAGACLPLGCNLGGTGDACAFGPRVEELATTIPGVQPGNWLRSPSACCSDACVDLTQDPNNCGVCGLTCPSGICALSGIAATCLPPGPDDDCPETCGPWSVCTDGQCVDSSCDSSFYCKAENGAVGICCYGPTVGAPAWCSDLANDPANCGGCGLACPAGQTCSQGACSGTPAECVHRLGGFCNLDAGLGYLCCPGLGCINTDSDNANCGNCGAACAAGTSCQSGSCA
jgi:hypothetical protein